MLKDRETGKKGERKTVGLLDNLKKTKPLNRQENFSKAAVNLSSVLSSDDL